MKETSAGPQRLRRHLVSPARVTAPAVLGDHDLTRRHGQGNGVRLHGIYFAGISLAALVLIIAAIALASTMAH